MERGLSALPGVAIFLKRLRDGGVPCCIGSSTHRENILTILGVLGWYLFEYLNYYSIAVWYYPNPSEAAQQIKGRVAFWKGVTVE